tara:strand:- start:3352 stop:4854 length:1503 start_codon:yes stop_codon:yes gene_type:complete
LKFIFSLNPTIQVIISGILIGLAYHPLNVGFLAMIGFIPLINIFYNGSLRDSVINGYIFGFVYNLTAFYWIGANSGAGFLTVISSLIAAVLYLSLYWSFTGYIFSLVVLNWGKSVGNFILPIIIVTMEWIRSFGPLGFPWSNLALTQSNYIYFIQIMEITGTYGITFIIVSTNVFIYHSIKKSSFLRNGLLPIIIFYFGISLAGRARIESLQNYEKKINAVIVQPNVDPNRKWHEKKRIISFMDSLHQEATKMNPDIIIFPETAFPSYLTRDHKTRRMLQKTVDESNVPLLTGTIDLILKNKKKNYYNSAMWLTPNNDFQMYSKIHLVPFAEYDLFPSIFHPLTWLNINIDRGSFRAGKDYKIFNLEGIFFSDIICYESSIPNVVREFVRRGSEFLIIQANDGWLGNSYGPHQHFELARLRAIENRIPILRSANTGISGVIRSDGTVQKKVGLNEQLIFQEIINISKSGSIYSSYGDIFALGCFLITLLISLLLCKKRFT